MVEESARVNQTNRKMGRVAASRHRCNPKTRVEEWDGWILERVPVKDFGRNYRGILKESIPFLIPTQAKRNLSSRSGIGGVLSAT